jgi:lipoprotein-anchoring transpeptidase ErfK/SrfK
MVGALGSRGMLGWSAVALGVSLVAVGCQSGPSRAAADHRAVAAATVSAAPEARIAVTPTDRSTKVRPDAEVAVRVEGGTLTDVTVTGAGGLEVPGEMDAGNTAWTASSHLVPATKYTIKAEATNVTGQVSTSTSTLKTLTPQDTAGYSLLPSDESVGVGMPIVVQFFSEVDQDKRADVERGMSVTTSPKVKGAWGWLDGRQLIWRPANYWRPGTKVSVQADVAGIETRDGLWTSRNATTSFTVGSAMVSTVDVQRHTLSVRRDGTLLRTIPITTGKAGFRTRNGIKVILTREASRQMNSETTGISKDNPDYYNVNVKYAMRLTWSGEFLHAAPWSVGAQGRDNVSHGCTGMSTENARWLFDNSKQGDVVKYIGSDRPLEEYNGYTMWNMPLSAWAAKSALA